MVRIPPKPTKFVPPETLLHHKEIYEARLDNRHLNPDSPYHMCGIHPDFTTFYNAFTKVLQHLDNLEGYIESLATCNEDDNKRLQAIEDYKGEMASNFDRLMRNLLPIDPDDAYEG